MTSGFRDVENSLIQRAGHSQQTRVIDPMLVQCWTTVSDGGPTLRQHRASVSCDPTRPPVTSMIYKRVLCWANIELILGQFWVHNSRSASGCLHFQPYVAEGGNKLVLGMENPYTVDVQNSNNPVEVIRPCIYSRSART